MLPPRRRRAEVGRSPSMDLRALCGRGSLSLARRALCGRGFFRRHAWKGPPCSRALDACVIERSAAPALCGRLRHARADARSSPSGLSRDSSANCCGNFSCSASARAWPDSDTMREPALCGRKRRPLQREGLGTTSSSSESSTSVIKKGTRASSMLSVVRPVLGALLGRTRRASGPQDGEGPDTGGSTRGGGGTG